MTEVESIYQTTDGRPVSFLSLLKDRAHELCPDYPFTQENAFEWLCALTSSVKGLDLACEDWWRRWQGMLILIRQLVQAGEMVMGDWKNVKTRDGLQEALNRMEQALKPDSDLMKIDWKSK